jgi:predicted phage tail protein
MKTFTLTFCFFAGFSLILWGVQQVQMSRSAKAEHYMTFDERAGHMFDNVQIPAKGDRLSPTPDLKGGALVDGHSVHALIFRPNPDAGMQHH